MPRPEFQSKKSILASIIRVNHSGEYGAVRIYKGQIDACKYQKTAKDSAILKEMLEQEKNHLSYFENKIIERSVRPSLLIPFWHISGYILGFVTRMMGDKTAMLCTEAVEDVIDKHYSTQLIYLKKYHKDEVDLIEKIEQYRLEELEHKSIAISHGSKEAPMFYIISNFIKQICKGAIAIARSI